MNNVYDKLKEMGIVLPSPPSKGGIYSPVKEFGRNYLYCSGCGPEVNGHNFIGKLGSDFTFEEGQMAAKNCLLNLLANLDQYLGDLNRIQCFAKLLGFVNCTDLFEQQPQVINGASELLKELFGDEIGLPARSAIGTNALPGGIACEIELLLEYK